MAVLEGVNPERVMYYFENICSIPHGSSNTKKISDYCVNFAKGNGLRYIQDKLNNVIIFKNASSDKQGSAPVIIQGHLDMVCAKENSCKKNMAIEGLDIALEDGYVKAIGTTLGADDGIAIAYALAILESKEISHPPLEVVFTVDEEIGLLGAAGIDLSCLKSKRLINIDSEEEGILTAGCAGGARVEVLTPVDWEEIKGTPYKIEISGLLGGHSGVDINKGRANANTLLFQLLNFLVKHVDFRIIDISGGDKDNVIANSTTAQIMVLDKSQPNIEEFVNNAKKLYPNEIGLKAECKIGKDRRDTCLTEQSTLILISLMSEIPNGVIKMSKNINGLVQTSLNFGSIRTGDSYISSVFSVRSSVKNEKEMLIKSIIDKASLYGSKTEVSGNYPAWECKEESPLRNTMCSIYRRIFNKELNVDVIHAGLECGIFFEKIKGLDAVSIGPDIKDIHTHNERLSVDSANRVFAYLLEVLKEL